SILAESEPTLDIRGVSASNIAARRRELLTDHASRATYLSEFVEMEGVQNFLNAVQNYPLLKGVQTNLYKCFLTRAWSNSAPRHVATACLHPEGGYDDPRGGALRRGL